MATYQDLSQLSFEKLEETQNALNAVFKQRAENFSNAVKNNNIDYLKNFISWGIPEKNYEFNNTIQTIQITEKTSTATIEVLERILKENHPKLYRLVYIKTQKCFSSLLDRNQSVNVYNNLVLLDNLNWLIENHPDIMLNYMKENLINNWGKFAFNPQKHQAVEKYVLSNISQPHKTLLKASSSANKKMIEYFYSPYYLKSLQTVSNSSEFFTECLEKALLASNKEAIEFWISKKVDLPTNKVAFNQLIKSGQDNETKIEIIKLLYDYVGNIKFNEQVLLNYCIEYDNLVLTKYLLDNYYVNEIEAGKEVLSSKSNISLDNKSMQYLNHFINYHLLNNELEDKSNAKTKFKL